MHFSFKSKQESGRSIVEMLGVLIIAGVLTVGGIGTYRYAVDSTHANTIISEARMRMVALSRHGAAKDEATSLKTLKGFWKTPEGDIILNKYQITLSQALGEGPILNISGISSGVCKRLKSMTNIPMKLNDEERSVAGCAAENAVKFDMALLETDPEYAGSTHSPSGVSSHGASPVSSNKDSEVSSISGSEISSHSGEVVSSTGESEVSSDDDSGVSVGGGSIISSSGGEAISSGSNSEVSSSGGENMSSGNSGDIISSEEVPLIDIPYYCEDDTWCLSQECIDNVCATLPIKNEACPHDVCAEGLSCINGICSYGRNLGEDCDDFHSCASDYACISGKCQERRQVGESCSSRWDCAYDLVCRNQTCSTYDPDNPYYPCTSSDECPWHLGCYKDQQGKLSCGHPLGGLTPDTPDGSHCYSDDDCEVTVRYLRRGRGLSLKPWYYLCYPPRNGHAFCMFEDGCDSYIPPKMKCDEESGTCFSEPLNLPCTEAMLYCSSVSATGCVSTYFNYNSRDYTCWAKAQYKAGKSASKEEFLRQMREQAKKCSGPNGPGGQPHFGC